MTPCRESAISAALWVRRKEKPPADNWETRLSAKTCMADRHASLGWRQMFCIHFQSCLKKKKGQNLPSCFSCLPIDSLDLFALHLDVKQTIGLLTSQLNSSKVKSILPHFTLCSLVLKEEITAVPTGCQMFAFWGHAPHQTCGPFKPKLFAEICPLFPLQRSQAVCVDLPNPPPQTSPPSPPSLSLSHPLSCAQQLILSSAKKTGAAVPQSGTPVPKADPDDRDPVTHLGSFYFEVVKGDGDGSSCDLQFTTVWTF